MEDQSRHYARFFSLSLDLLCIAGMDGYFRELSLSWEKALGFSRQELTARPWLDFVHPEDRDATMAAGSKLSGGVQVISFENRYLCKNGGYKWLRWNALPIPEENLIYAVATDVTDLKTAEEALKKSHEELESFSYSVSHDLRAPLRHIDGFIELLSQRASGGLDEKSRHYLTVIAGAAKHMSALIDDLLAFSRMGRAAMEKSQVDLSSLVGEVVRELEPDAKNRNVEWRLSQLPRVHCDPAMMRLVFSNLLGNALKFTRPRPAAIIETGSIREPGRLVVYVRDNGVGFDMQYASKLFGVFQRLHSQEEFEGTGIGLANVRRIIQRHGGEAWAEGKVAQGATFYFALPQDAQEPRLQSGRS